MYKNENNSARGNTEDLQMQKQIERTNEEDSGDEPIEQAKLRSQSNAKEETARGANPSAAQERRAAFATYLNICALAMVGCSVRIGLGKGMGSSGVDVESSDGVIFQAFISNMVGSLFLGLLVGSTLKGLGGMLPLYVGISTGLCGSVTTLSKFNQQVSLMIIGEANPDGNRFFIAFLSILLGLSAPISSFVVGRDISTRLCSSTKQNSNKDKTLTIAKPINYLLSILFILSWITLIVISIYYRDEYSVISICLSIVLAPFGAMLRFILAKLNHKQHKLAVMNIIPVGTLAANFLGSLILAAAHVILTWVPMSCPWTAVLVGIGSGFCACLTTVSTLVSEIQGMRGKGDHFYSHLYPFCTLILCLSFASLINGVSYAVSIDQPPFNSSCV